MKRLGKLSLIITLILFILPFSNENLYAAEEVFIEENAIILLSEVEEEIVIFEDIFAEKPLITVENNTVAKLVNEKDDEEDFVKISVVDEQGEEVEGYVSREYITYPIEEDPVKEEKTDKDIAEKVETNVEEKLDIKSHSTLENNPVEKQPNIKAAVEEIKTMSLTTMSTTTQTTEKNLYGIALKSQTHVYSDTNRNSSKLKSYPIGTELKYQTYNSNWYKATVYISGKRHTGYIHKDDVDTYVSSKGKTFYSYGIKHPTHVYESPDASSKSLKSYDFGHRLKFKALTENWYEATVYISGKAHKGYISKEDLSDKLPSTIKGYAQSKTTNVYESISKSSRVLKSYLGGQLLKYRPYDTNWYIATVYLSGKPTFGFIHKDDVGEEITALYGYAQLDSTNVYQSTSKSSPVLKSYRAGSILKYSPYNDSWYVATVYLNGKAHTGYIHKNDVGSRIPTIQGYAQLEPTNVYQSKSRTSRVLKSYRAGVLLKYRPNNNDWYEATVYINGAPRKGYIHKNDVGDNIPTLYGLSVKQPTSVYSKTSRTSSKLKNYRKGHVLKYLPHNSSWYKATVYINGKAQTGYIHRDDVITSTGKVVVIDAGHGGRDPGAVRNGIKEKELNLDIAKRTQQLLEKAGFIVIMTRTSDYYRTLSERTNLANKHEADIFVSIHANAFNGSAHGIETYWYNKGPEPQKSKLLAEQIQNELIKQTKANNRGVKGNKNLHVNRESKMPSALVEVGFIDNKTEAEKLKTSNYRNQIAQGIANGIKKFFQLFS